MLMEQLYRHLGSSSVWSEKETDWSLFEAIEIWHSQTSGRLWIQHSGLSLSVNLSDDWTKRDSDGELFYRLARFVTVGKNPEQQGKSTSTEDFSKMVDHLGLRLAYDYAMSCVAGVAALPPESKSNSEVRAYTLVYHPKLAAIWSFTRPVASSTFPGRPSSTQAIILASSEERARLKSLLDMQWDLVLTSHAMFPAFLCGLVMSHEVNETQNSIKVGVRQVEVRTGHHNFASRHEQPATGEMGQLSATMSGFATKLASTSRKIHVAKELQRFMLMHAGEREDMAGISNEGAATKLIPHHVELMHKRLEMQLLDNEFILERVKIQLNAIFNLIAQRDSFAGLQTARASQFTAQSSMQDSSSMKTLALVALAFLPGNFVAALFSAPLFDWDRVQNADLSSIGVGLKPQFNLYWAITGPLTVLSFVIYVGWLLLQRRQRHKYMQGFEKNLDKCS